MDISRTTAYMIYRAKAIQIEMLEDRHLIVDPDNKALIALDFEEFFNFFVEEYKKDPDTSVTQTMNEVIKDNPPLHVYWPIPAQGTKLPKAHIDAILTDIQSTKGPGEIRIMVIANVPLGPEAKKALMDSVGGDRYRAEVFTYDELLLNPRKWYKVPEHVRLTGEERDRYVKHLATKDSNPSMLPKIYDSDRIARHYGYHAGDIIRIYRKAFINVGNVRAYYIAHRTVIRDVTV